MSTIYEEEEHYGLDSPEAILHCAVAVACCDGEFAGDEHDRVRSVYTDICQELAFQYNRPDISDEYEDIAQGTAELVFSLNDTQERLKYIEHCGRLITDRDLREMTLVMALRIAGGDSELDDAEFQALKTLADVWHIRLKDVLEPYRGT